MSSVIYVIFKSRASHSDDYMCVVFAIVAGTSVLQSPCLTHGQGIWSSPMILSPLVAENLWVYYRCHLPVPSSRLAPPLGFKSTEQLPLLWKFQAGICPPGIRDTMCHFGLPALLLWPLHIPAVTWPAGHGPCCCPHWCWFSSGLSAPTPPPELGLSRWPCPACPRDHRPARCPRVLFTQFLTPSDSPTLLLLFLTTDEGSTFCLAWPGLPGGLPNSELWGL